MFPPANLALHEPIPPPPALVLPRNAAAVIATALDAVAAPTAAGVGIEIPSALASQTADATTSYVVVSPTEQAQPPSSLKDGTPPPPPPPGAPPSPLKADGEGDCRLLGPFALLVQLALGALAMLSLVYKRWRERPQRPVKIWFFDVSKQVFGSALVHVANVFMSLLTSGRFSMKLGPPPSSGSISRQVEVLRRAAGLVLEVRDAAQEEYVPNPCSFYLLNLGIDTTLGIPILIFLLHFTTRIAARTPFGQPAESIKSGNYGHPPRAWWWFKQSLIYFCGLMGMKFVVLVLFMIFPWLARVGDWALRWTEGNEELQIVFVMMLFPLIMNALQYYIIDSFIKLKEDDGEQHHGSDDAVPGALVGSGAAAYQELAVSSESDDEDGGRGEEDRKIGDPPQSPRRQRAPPNPIAVGRDGESSEVSQPGRRRSLGLGSPGLLSPAGAEYDPDVDGETRTEAVVSSGSSTTTDTRIGSGKGH